MSKCFLVLNVFWFSNIYCRKYNTFICNFLIYFLFNVLIYFFYNSVKGRRSKAKWRKYIYEIKLMDWFHLCWYLGHVDISKATYGISMLDWKTYNSPPHPHCNKQKCRRQQMVESSQCCTQSMKLQEYITNSFLHIIIFDIVNMHVPSIHR